MDRNQSRDFTLHSMLQYSSEFRQTDIADQIVTKEQLVANTINGKLLRLFLGMQLSLIKQSLLKVGNPIVIRTFLCCNSRYFTHFTTTDLITYGNTVCQKTDLNWRNVNRHPKIQLGKFIFTLIAIIKHEKYICKFFVLDNVMKRKISILCRLI